jgi:uncharacterized protein YbbK (DUF523 family)
MADLPRVGISRCLLGDQVRYDGGHKHEAALLDILGAHVEWVPVCPELEVGMGVPREPVQLAATGGDRRVRLVGADSGADWTDRMEAWAAERIAALRAAGLAGFVLKSRSPSCGPHEVAVRSGGSGPGLFALALLTAMPGLPVEDEERLRHPEARALFLERVIARHRGWQRSHQ